MRCLVLANESMFTRCGRGNQEFYSISSPIMNTKKPKQNMTYSVRGSHWRWVSGVMWCGSAVWSGGVVGWSVSGGCEENIYKTTNTKKRQKRKKEKEKRKRDEGGKSGPFLYSRQKVRAHRRHHPCPTRSGKPGWTPRGGLGWTAARTVI